MSDRPESTCFDPDSPLRQTYAHLLRREEIGPLAALCGSLLELTREAPVLSGALPIEGMRSALRAGLSDLRHVAAHLAYTGRSEGAELSREDARLGDQAEALAARLKGIAEELDSVLGGAA